MQVDVISSVNEARSDDFINKTVMVVDVFRATSTIITALENGCLGVLPVETVGQARNLQRPGDLLGGERFCKKIIGFDLGNSPFEYMDPLIQGRRIVMTTTNGTRAIQKSQKAQHVLAGSMLNAASCAKAALELRRDVVIVCAGTNDEFSLEDGMCAGLLTDELMKRSGAPLELNDIGRAMYSLYKYNQDDLEETLLQCVNGRRLSRLGLKEDLIFCMQIDRFTVVPMLHGDTMLPFLF